MEKRQLNRMKGKIYLAIVLVCLSALSFFVLGTSTSSVDKNQGNIDKINTQIDNVLKLSASATVASVAVSAIPDDTATPIADKLSDFTGYFLIILCVLYAEKYLLTILGFGVFKILIPLAFLILAITLFAQARGVQNVCLKIAALGLALYFVIPVSLGISDMVYKTYDENINTAIEATEQFSDEASALTEADGDKNILSSILDQLSETVDSLKEKAVTIMNNMLETLAMLIVTSCVIPLLVLAAAVWFVKILTGVDLLPKLQEHMPHGDHGRREEVSPFEHFEND